MAKSGVKALNDMCREQRLVRFKRKFEESSICGYILDVGPKFFLLAVVSDRIWFDGFECFRIADAYELEPDSRVQFVEAALKKRRERLIKKLPIKLDSVADILRSASRKFPLLTIHTEQKDPEVCWIGHVMNVDSEFVSLLHIRPDAVWEAEPSQHTVSDITRINFGGDYENALFEVGGEPGK